MLKPVSLPSLSPSPLIHLFTNKSIILIIWCVPYSPRTSTADRSFRHFACHVTKGIDVVTLYLVSSHIQRLVDALENGEMKEIRGNKFKLPNQKEVELFLKLEQVLLSRDHVKEMCIYNRWLRNGSQRLL